MENTMENVNVEEAIEVVDEAMKSSKGVYAVGTLAAVGAAAIAAAVGYGVKKVWNKFHKNKDDIVEAEDGENVGHSESDDLPDEIAD